MFSSITSVGRFVSQFIIVCSISSGALAAVGQPVHPLLWNKLGSASEVTNSAFGPNLGFYNTTSFPDTIGNPAYVPGVFGNGVSIGPGSYASQAREHTIIWSNVDQYLNPNRGTIETWFKQNSDPVAFDHGVYRIFDGSYGLGSGVGFTSEIPFGPPPLLNFGVGFGGTDVVVASNISAFNGTWIHVAGVWDRNGIGNTADTVRLYVNGNVVASTTAGGWGTTVGQFADIAGGNDNNIAGQFAMDNLKVYDGAVTDFSGRFNETTLPEPGIAIVFIGVLSLSQRRTRRS